MQLLQISFNLSLFRPVALLHNLISSSISLIQALWTLYELSTTEGWLDVTLAAVDVREIDMQPIRDYDVSWAFLFIIFMFTGIYRSLSLLSLASFSFLSQFLIPYMMSMLSMVYLHTSISVHMIHYLNTGSFFFMNLFVGVLYERFVQAQSDLEGGTNFLTKEQEEYIVAQRLRYSIYIPQIDEAISVCTCVLFCLFHSAHVLIHFVWQFFFIIFLYCLLLIDFDCVYV